MDFEDDSMAPTSPAGPEDALDLTLSPAEPVLRPEGVPVPEWSPLSPSDPLYDVVFTPPEHQQPSIEPDPAVTESSEPATSAVPGAAAPPLDFGPLQLDPSVAQLYAPAAPGEDFLRSRRRVDQQETLSFQPVRQPPQQRPEPTRRQPDSDEALYGQVFTIEDMDPSTLPDGWTMRDGYICLAPILATTGR